jgi:ferredoxin-NADP reductase
MLAKKYKSTIVSIDNPIEGIYTLELESQRRPYKYSPGQFLHFALDADYDGVGQWPESRCFSMQSNPREETVKMTYAVKGGFTREMEQTLKAGSEIWLKLPYGNLFQQTHSKDKTVFIAGGTGITPFLSLFTDESFAGYQNPKIYLGFRSKEFNIYEREIELLNACIATFYQDSNGIIDIERIFEDNGTDSDYFISGPPAMIKEFKSSLIENDVHPQNILTDDWE